MKKFMLKVMPIVFLCLVVCGTVFAAGSNGTFDSSLANPGAGISEITGLATKIWGTVLTILQICAVAAVVFAGVKYMFANSDAKAEIKNSMIGLVIGALLVFAASGVINFILRLSSQAGI